MSLSSLFTCFSLSILSPPVSSACVGVPVMHILIEEYKRFLRTLFFNFSTANLADIARFEIQLYRGVFIVFHRF